MRRSARLTTLLSGTAAISSPTAVTGLWGWWDLSDITQLKSDTAGSVAVANTGDTIGRILDKSGNSRTMISPNNVNRPIYRTNIQNGKSAASWYEDAGVDLLVATATLATSDLTLFCVFKTPAALAGATQFGLMSAYHSVNGGSRIMVESTATKISGQTSPTTASILSTSAATVSTNYIVSYQVAATPRKRMTVNGQALTVDTTANSAPSSVDVRLGVSHINNNNSPWTGGYIYEALVYSPVLSDADTALVLGYLNSKWLVY